MRKQQDRIVPAEVPINRSRLQIGIRVALEEMVFGRDYARVEDILRALAEETECTSLDLRLSDT